MLRVALKEYVHGFASLANFAVGSVAAPAADQLRRNQLLLRPLYVSVDPHQRGYMGGSGYALGEAITNYLVARVVASTSDAFAQGDVVADMAGKWQSLYIADAASVHRLAVRPGVEPRDHLGVLGPTAFTAWYGLSKVQLNPGETILVSSASGGVGQVAVQLARLRGLRVVGVAGSDAKVEHVKQLGAEAAFNYKTCGDFAAAIKRAAPQGVDVYFDNVAGPFLDAAIMNLNHGARIVGCGVTSQKNVAPADQYGLKNLFHLIFKEARLVGINVGGKFDSPEHAEFVEQMARLYHGGKIKYQIDELHGLESAPQALIDLYEGKNFGKTIIK
ncbi:hypothetical protein H4S02_008151, partial [Coemansia sp. RSA 2611]